MRITKQNLILLLSLIFVSLQAQYRSIISANGDGRVFSSAFSQNSLAGGISAAYSSSNVHNMLNPASYADAVLTAVEVGTKVETGAYTYRDSTMNSGGLGLSHFAILLPLTAGKSGLGFGFHQRTNTDYGITYNFQDPGFGAIQKQQTGDGNTYQAFVGSGFRFGNLKLGGSFLVNFGSVKHTDLTKFVDSLKLPNLRVIDEFSNMGVSYNIGAQYGINLNKTNQILLGGYYQNSIFQNMSQRNQKHNIYNLGADGIRSLSIADTSIDLATLSMQQFGLGFSWVANNALLVGTEFNFNSTGGRANRLDALTTTDAWYVRSGLEYRPSLLRKNDSRKYLNRVTYRFGGGLGRNEHSFDGSMNDIKLTAGATFPVLSRSIGYITTGLEYNYRTNMGSQQISESILTVKIILTFADRWFIRSKFD